MIKKYRVVVVGPVPKTLKEQIASLHAAGILKSEEKVESRILPAQVTKKSYG